MWLNLLSALGRSHCDSFPDINVHGANMGPTWVLPAPDGPHVGPMNLAIRVAFQATIMMISCQCYTWGITDPLCGGSTGHRWISSTQAEPWWRASIWRSHRKVVMKQCSYHNNIIDIQNRLPYSKVVYPAIIVLFSCLLEVNHGVRTGPDYPFRKIKSHFEVVPRYTCRLFTLKRNHMPRK